MYDYLIQNGILVDGTGAKPVPADLAIQGSRIAAIAPPGTLQARTVVDARGKVVAPGFIDIHCHSDLTRRVDNRAENKLYQGVTTEIGGNCGLSVVPAPQDDHEREIMLQNTLQCIPAPYVPDTIGVHDLDELAAFVDRTPGPTHLGILVGHNALRGMVVGYEKRDATDREMERMQALLEMMLQQGAFGLSLGLVYAPGIFCKTEELIELAAVVSRYGGMMSVHMRDESEHIDEALCEVFRIAEESGVHLHISHLKLMGKRVWGRAEQVLETIERARARGIQITADQYPYDASSTSLNRTVPNWAHAGGLSAMVKRLRDPKLLPQIKAEMAEEIERRGGPDCIRISDSKGVLPEIEDRTLDAIGAAWGLSPVDAAVDILLRCDGSAGCISHSISPEDLRTIMRQPWICVGSDGMTYTYEETLSGKPHRRNFGAFPHFLEMVRQEQLMPLEIAIYKLTGCPAKALGLSDIGVLRPGNRADITVFDYDRIADRSTYSQPQQKPAGIEQVFVSGRQALRDGVSTQDFCGTLIRRKC